MSQTHGFGIVGAGVIARTHAEAIASVSGAQVVAVTDVDSGRCRNIAEVTGAAAEPHLGSLLARPDVDVVAVCVPSGLHAEVGVAAAAAGKHLVVEKPIDVTLAAADRLIEAVKQAGVTMTVISQHRFDAGLIELRRLLDEGALGQLVLGEASTKWYRSQAYYDSADWRGTWALDGGSLMNQGVHYVDLLRWCMGPVTEVTALFGTSSHQVEVEDVALAMLRFASGAVGTLVSSTAVYPGFAQRLEISGTGGSVVVEDGEIVYRGLRDEAQGPGGATATGASPPAGGLDAASHAAQIADLLAAIDTGRQPAVTADSARDALEIVCAVYQSAREGRPVALR